MKCPRCEGLMVSERLMDIHNSILSIEAWRCLNCGFLLDDVIAQHRERVHSEMTTMVHAHREAA